MSLIAVYRFTWWDQKTGKTVVDARFATLRAVKMCNGRNIEDTRRLVDSGEIDPQGFHKAPAMRQAAN